jgi:hypothetical protein
VAHNPAIARKDLHWPLHPEYSQGLHKLANGYLTSPWYEKERQHLVVPALIAQELDLDFAGSSSPLFPADLIERLLREEARPPVMRGRLEHRAGTEPLFVEDRNGALLLWTLLAEATGRPAAADRFAVAADIGAGVRATPSVLCVADRRLRQKVAELSTDGLFPDKFAELCVAVCRFFNDAFLIWESNGMSGQVFGNRVVALGYQNIYYRRDKRGLKHKLAKGIVPGWHATPENKDAVLGEYLRALANGAFINRSRDAIHECCQYVWLPNNHVENEHALTSSAVLPVRGFD